MFLKVLKQLRAGILLLPFLLQGIGTVFNVLVVTVNHGAMPVVIPIGVSQLKDDPYTHHEAPIETYTPGQVLDDRHTVYDPKDIHLVVLCDWIEVPWWGAVSPGDLLLWLGDISTTPLICVWLCLLYVGKHEEIESRPDLYGRNFN
jgi:hypothetical protein